MELISQKITQLPTPFVSWYWDLYCDGYESPSYILYNNMAEYGCSQHEYYDSHGDIVHEEVKDWIVRNLSIERIIELLDKWNECVRETAERYNTYYIQTKQEVESIKIKIQSGHAKDTDSQQSKD